MKHLSTKNKAFKQGWRDLRQRLPDMDHTLRKQRLGRLFVVVTLGITAGSTVHYLALERLDNSTVNSKRKQPYFQTKPELKTGPATFGAEKANDPRKAVEQQ